MNMILIWNILNYFEIFWNILKIFWKYENMKIQCHRSQWIKRIIFAFWNTSKTVFQPELCKFWIFKIFEIFSKYLQNIQNAQASVDHKTHFRLLKYSKSWSPGNFPSPPYYFEYLKYLKYFQNIFKIFIMPRPQWIMRPTLGFWSTQKAGL